MFRENSYVFRWWDIHLTDGVFFSLHCITIVQYLPLSHYLLIDQWNGGFKDRVKLSQVSRYILLNLDNLFYIMRDIME